MTLDLLDIDAFQVFQLTLIILLSDLDNFVSFEAELPLIIVFQPEQLAVKRFVESFKAHSVVSKNLGDVLVGPLPLR